VIKLRSIEILVQQQAEVLEGQGKAEDPTLHNIQAILYSTEVRSLLYTRLPHLPPLLLEPARTHANLSSLIPRKDLNFQ
jgi:hypothetical protein